MQKNRRYDLVYELATGTLERSLKMKNTKISITTKTG
jgi:hypothetical protein